MNYCCGFPTFWRDYTRLDHPVATEHTMYSSIDKLWKKGIGMWITPNKLSYTEWKKNFISWNFKDDAASPQAAAGNINVEFWQGSSDYTVTWKYDGTCNCYKRENGGTPHMDLNNNQQLSAKNIVVQFERESRANDGYEGNVHLLYKTIGEGKALIFQDGKMVEGKWSKASRLARSKYTDSKGKEILFNKGVIWIQTVPEGARVSY